MACDGYIKGFPDGNFYPNQAVRRGEYTQMLDGPFRWHYIIPTNTPTSPLYHFTDIANSIFHDSIEIGYAKGAISGYSQDTCGNSFPCFKPNGNISRAEMAKLIAVAAGLTQPAPNQIFYDVPPNHWAYTYIQENMQAGTILGGIIGPGQPGCEQSPDLPCFKPNDPATRGQIAYALYIASNGPYNGVYGHCCRNQYQRGEYEGSNNYDFFFTRDPIIPGGYMVGTLDGSDGYRANAEKVVWTQDSIDWLIANEFPMSGGDWKPAIVLHVFDGWQNENICSTGQWDNNNVDTDLPAYRAPVKSGCQSSDMAEMRVFNGGRIDEQLYAGHAYHVRATWHQSGTYSGAHRTTIDNYHMDTSQQPFGPPWRDSMNKFCLNADADNRYVTWCPPPTPGASSRTDHTNKQTSDQVPMPTFTPTPVR